MVLVDEKKSTPAEWKRNTSINSIIQHYALIYPEKFAKKPGAEVGKIHNHFKRNPYAKPYTLAQIVDAFCSGQTLTLAMVELELKNAADREKAAQLDRQSSEWADLHTTVFKSTQLLGIDIDDTYSETSVADVIAHFKGRVSAAYYSFSHGRANDRGGHENRYRLLFQFDKPITDYEIGKEIVKVIKNELLQLYPTFPESKIDTMTPKTLWHGSKSAPAHIDEGAILSTAEYTSEAEKAVNAKREALKAKRKHLANTFKKQTENPVTFEELKAMAEAIGHIAAGTGEFEKWRNLSLSIRSHEYSGLITHDEGYQLFDIISGGESSEADYFKFNPNGEISIGTFINHATAAGYKRKHKRAYALQEVREAIEREVLKVDKYLPTEVAKELIQRKEKLLVDSPTGSGKTTAIMRAFKELATDEYKFYIFTAHTRPLTQQIAEDHDVMGITGGIPNLRGEIKKRINRGERVFATTFDKVGELVSHLSKRFDYENGAIPEFSIVVDEIHSFTQAYNYRFAAIDRLEELTSAAVSFIGLSGTVEDVFKDKFDKLIKIETGGRKSPCLDYRVFTYEKQSDADIMIIPVIRGLLQQTKVLLFINSKERIDRVAKMLRKLGIATQTVTSETKESPAYKNIVETGTIAEDTQVVIATTVLADGISLKNALNWSCLVAVDQASPIFNPSTIKQISNRFRNPYRYFGLYMHQANPKFAEENRFFIESEFQYRKRVVSGYVDYLNSEFEADQLQSFLPSNVERYNGIYYRSSEEEAEIKYNPLFIRYQSMKQKEKYYALFRNAFIAEVGRQLSVKSSGTFNVNAEVAANDSDLSGLIADMEEEKETGKKKDAELRQMFATVFDETFYNCFVRGDQEALKLFKQDVHPDQYAATLKNCTIADYETCKQVGAAITRKADIYTYFNDIKALAEIASFDYVKKTTVTKRVFNELMSISGEVYTSKDFKGILERVQKKAKVSEAVIKEALKLFHKFSERTGGESTTAIEPLSVELVAKVRHQIAIEKVEDSVLKYTLQRNAHQQRILLPAIAEKWGIKSN